MMAMATGVASWMANGIRDPGTETYAATAEPRPRRLEQRLIDAISDIAWGVEAGDAGLKSISAEPQVAQAYASAADHFWHAERGGRMPSEYRDAASTAHTDVIADVWDEYLNELGSLLHKGYRFREAFDHLQRNGWETLIGGGQHLLALERWLGKTGTRCDPDQDPPEWRASRRHEDRRRAARALAGLRESPQGKTHLATLHIVYGPPDPFLLTLTSDTLRTLGKELAPLARYTDAVEVYRQKLVREEASKRSRREHVPARARHSEGSFLAALAHHSEVADAFRVACVEGVDTKAGLTDEKIATVYDLNRRRTAHAWADRVISSGDAIRAALAPFTEPQPEQGPGESRVELERRREARAERKRLHGAAIDAFLVAVKIEANRMLTEASRAFEASWARS